MAVPRFFHVQLRTLDVDEARAFYGSLLPAVPPDIVPLHEDAVARGARPHWLGYIQVDDVDDAASAFAARGATRLGPTRTDWRGLQAAVLRDPCGAVVAVGRPPAQPIAGAPDVVWRDLHAVGAERAMAVYGEILGWTFGHPFELADLGTFHPFAYRRGETHVGCVSDVLGREGVHPHWLFHFPVQELESAMSTVRAAGGIILGPFTLPDGSRVAVCDDAQAAAFALRETSR